MITYVYDGTFEGILTCVYQAYYTKEKPDKIVKLGDWQQSIFETQISISTDITKYKRVYNSIRIKISEDALQNVYNTYLSEVDNSGIYILNYLRLGFKVGSSVDNYIFDDMVKAVINSSRKVISECHMMLGLLRFRNLKGNVFYSEIEPKYNILELIAPHFNLTHKKSPTS